jgi:hypothetical protein
MMERQLADMKTLLKVGYEEMMTEMEVLHKEMMALMGVDRRKSLS